MGTGMTEQQSHLLQSKGYCRYFTATQWSNVSSVVTNHGKEVVILKFLNSLDLNNYFLLK